MKRGKERLDRLCKLVRVRAWIRESAENRWIWVTGAACPCVVFAEAMGASGDYLRPPCEGLIVEAGICDGPVEVFTSQHIPPELAVVCDQI